MQPPTFNNDEAARKLIESIRWPDGPVCSHCGTINHAYAVKGRAGLLSLRREPECRKDFTVHDWHGHGAQSNIPLHKWMMGFYLMNASKKGISAHQLHRALGIDLSDRLGSCAIASAKPCARWRPRADPLGGEGKIVEADETYFGPVEEADTRTKTTTGRKFTKGGTITARRTSAPWCRWSSAAAASARSMPPAQTATP